MSRSEVPDPDCSPLLVAKQVIRCLAADLDATRRAGARAPAAPTQSARDYLNRLIRKPWGSEFRVYEDDLADVWCLHIRAGYRTSLHCHLRKRTALLCLDGRGTLSTCSGVQHALHPGVVLQIEPGAYHRTTADARTALRLVEVETPKDKFDLLRIEDDHRSIGEPYEGEDHAALRLLDRAAAPGAPLALQPFVAQRLPGGHLARLRAPGSCDGYRFALRTGEQIRTSTDVVFAIALEPRSMTAPALTVLTPQCTSAASRQAVYLTIHKEKSMSRAVIITGPGFQDQDVIYTYYRLKEARFDVDIATKTDPATGNGIRVTGRYGVPVPLDKTAREPIPFTVLATHDAVERYDLVVLPGGYEAPDRVRQDPDVKAFLRAMDGAGKVIAGLCHGPWIMISAGIMRGRHACAYIGMRDDMTNAGAQILDQTIVVDDNIVTCSYYGEVGTFMKTVINLVD